MRSVRRWLPACAAVLLPVLSARAQEGPRPPVFPGAFGVEGRWEAFDSGPSAAKPAAVRSLIDDDAGGATIVKRAEGLYLSVWAAVDRTLRTPAARGDFELAELRRLQDDEARVLLEAVRRSGDPERIIGVFRRCPWSAAVHESLADFGEACLRRGRSGTASRCFADVLARSEDRELRVRAQAGLLAAMAAEPAAAPLWAGAAGADPDLELPWLGGKAPLSVIGARLSAGAAAKPAEIESSEPRLLKTPPAWAYDGVDKLLHADLRRALAARPGDLTATPHGLLAAGPGRIGLYPPGAAAPLWSLTEGPNLIARPAPSDAPGPFSPAFDGRRIYTRWGIDAPVPGRDANRREGHHRRMAGLAAIDAATGAIIWSTDGDPAWDEIRPCGDPVLSEGRLYVLVIGKVSDFAPVLLVCLDAASGSMLWSRELLSAAVPITPVGPGARGRSYESVDVTHFGHAVTVAGGAVYCSTNLGAVARCDARDGLVEWLRTYPRESAGKTVWQLAARRGASPLPAGKRVLFMPRDRLGVFALDADTGEAAWDRADDVSQRALGLSGERLLLTDDRRVAAIDVTTGRTAWERGWRGGLQAVLAGGSVHSVAGSNLLRLSAESGAILEQHDRSDDSSLTGLIVHDGRLVAISPDGSSPPPAEPVRRLPAPTVVAVMDSPPRPVWRSERPPALSADPADGDAPDTAVWGTAGAAGGKLLIGHDGTNLHVGLTCPAAAASPALGRGAENAGTRLEVQLAIDYRAVRFRIACDEHGRAIVESASSAAAAGIEEVTARVSHDLADGRLVFRFTAPLKLLYHDGGHREWYRRPTVTLTVRDGAAQLARVEERLSLQRASHEDEDAARAMAAELPDHYDTWIYLQSRWRARNPSAAPLSGFYSEFIRGRPQSPLTRWTLVLLDQMLRTAPAADPAPELGKMLADAGAPADLREWYAKTSALTFSQWVRLDPDDPPAAIAVELNDAGTWPRVAVWGDVKAFSRKGAAPYGLWRTAGPLPPAGEWVELKFPLAWLEFGDKPINGIAFRRRGGGKVSWDRSAVSDGSREIVFLDDTLPDGRTDVAWDWTESSAKSGRRAHLSPAATKEEPLTRHGVLFKEPVAGHLPAPLPTPPNDDARMLQVIRERLPGMRCGEYASALFNRADGLLAADPAGRKEFRKAVLTKCAPDERFKWLEAFVRSHRWRNEHGYGDGLEALIRECRLPDELVAEFRSRLLHSFLRNWQVAGPFPNVDDQGLSAAYGPESVPFSAAAVFDGVAGKVKWKPLAAVYDRIDLDKSLMHDPAGIAYAICWVRSAAPRIADMHTGSTDGLKVWFNRKAVLDNPGRREAESGQESTRVEFAAGWNEVLVKLESRAGRCSFFLEFRDPRTGKPLDALETRNTPPPPRPQPQQPPAAPAPPAAAPGR